MNLPGKAITFLFFLLYSGQALSYEEIGEVIKIRGNVTQLRPGDQLARKVSDGEKLLEDTSVLTGPKSMVMIRMRDRSTLTLGPESKMVLVEAENDEDPGVISLLNGHLRSKVQRQNRQSDNDHKQLISTRSAAMGVRGTDYIVSHNSENNVTSLVTLQGEVEMAQIDESYIREIEKSFALRRQARIERYDENSVELRDVRAARLKARGRLKVALMSKNKSKVGAGHHAGTVAEFKNISRPVRIAPEQFEALYKNRDLSMGETGEVLVSSKDYILPKELQYASNSASPLGIRDSKSKVFAPKAGGLVDLKSALYIPPTQDAAFHEGHNLFVSQQVGQIDAKTGNYLPPEGLHLDPLKGFQVDEDYAAALALEQRELLAKNSESLNQQLEARFIVGKAKADKNASKSPRLLSSRELMTKNILEASLGNYGHSLTYDSSLLRQDFDASSVTALDLSLSHSSGRNWQLITGINYKDLRFESVKQDDSTLFGLELGARYYLTSRLNAVAKYGLQQNFYIEEVDGVESLSSLNLSRLSAGLEWEAVRTSNWSFGLDAHLHRVFSKETRELQVEGAFGLELNIQARYWYSSVSAFEFGPRFQMIEQDQSNSNSSGPLERNESGLTLTYKRVF